MNTASHTALLDTYKQAEALLSAGNLRQSADLCKQILDTDPDFALGYHLMASLFRTTGNLDKALSFAQMAVARAPEAASFHMQLGQVYYTLNQWPQAAESFTNARRLEPENPYHVLLLADVCVQQERFDDAFALFAEVRAMRSIPEIDEHEGLAFMIQGDLDAAERLFDKVLQKRPDYFYGYIHKGKVLLSRNEDFEAERLFSKALLLKPDAHEALHGMALICERANKTDLALRYATQTVQAHPRGWNSYALLGALLLDHRQYEGAEQMLRQAHELKSDNIFVLERLVSALIRREKRGEAIRAVDKLLAVKPDDPALTHLRHILSGENTETAPKEFVAGLFDGYADRFDHHLQTVLSYQTPQKLADLVSTLPEAKTGMSLLDLGCGTGLAAEALKNITSLRVGIDLSEKMLEKARARGLYESLHALDIVEFLLASDRQFDLITAADVLVYIGNLAPFLKNARNALAANSLLAFSIEKGPSNEDYRLQTSGRYTHSARYVLELAREQGYMPVAQKDVVLRTENYQPVDGILFVFKKSPTH